MGNAAWADFREVPYTDRSAEDGPKGALSLQTGGPRLQPCPGLASCLCSLLWVWEGLEGKYSWLQLPEVVSVLEALIILCWHLINLGIHRNDIICPGLGTAGCMGKGI